MQRFIAPLFLCISLTTAVHAAPRVARTERDMARVQCEREANAMRYSYKTVMRRNFIRDCMVEKGFQSR